MTQMDGKPPSPSSLGRFVARARARAREVVGHVVPSERLTVLIVEPNLANTRRLTHAVREAAAAPRFPQIDLRCARSEREALGKLDPAPWLAYLRADSPGLDALALASRLQIVDPYIEPVLLCSHASLSSRAALFSNDEGPLCLDIDEAVRLTTPLLDILEVTRRATIEASEHVIVAREVAHTFGTGVAAAFGYRSRKHAKPPTLLEAERDLLREALRSSAGNRAAAARILGITRQALYRLMRKHDVGNHED